MTKIYLDLILRALMVLIELQINKGGDNIEADMDATIQLTIIQDDLEKARETQRPSGAPS